MIVETIPQPQPEVLPSPEIVALKREIEELKRNHDIELTRAGITIGKWKAEAEEARLETAALLESPLLKVFSEGGNMDGIESRLLDLAKRCATASVPVKGLMTIKLTVTTGRNKDGPSADFSITDEVKQPVEDTGACILWIDGKGKLSGRSSKQQDLLDVPPSRKPRHTDDE